LQALIFASYVVAEATLGCPFATSGSVEGQLSDSLVRLSASSAYRFSALRVRPYGSATQEEHRYHVRKWHKADLTLASTNIRCWGTGDMFWKCRHLRFWTQRRNSADMGGSIKSPKSVQVQGKVVERLLISDLAHPTQKFAHKIPVIKIQCLQPALSFRVAVRSARYDPQAPATRTSFCRDWPGIYDTITTIWCQCGYMRSSS